MTLIKNHEFALAWWPITKEELKISKKQKEDPNIKAWTINGASDDEIRQIRDWCDSNGVRLFKPSKWDDSWYDRTSEIYVEFINNEMTAITDLMIGDQLDAWLRSLPKRNAAVLLEGVTIRQVKRWTEGSNVRIIADLFEPQRYIASIDDDELAIELALRSD